VLGDGITITLKQILIRTYDGDLDTLKGLMLLPTPSPKSVSGVNSAGYANIEPLPR
jgi:hypothetical protein